MMTTQQTVADEVHIAQARRWLLRRHKIEGGGLVPAERITSLARMICKRFDTMFDQQWSENAAWTVLHDSDPAVVVDTLRDFAQPALIAFEFAIERAEHGVTTNPDILASDRRADELELQTLSPRARSERARVDYLTTSNQIEAGEVVPGEQAADQFRQALAVVNREIRNIARRVANIIGTFEDHDQIAGQIGGELKRVKGDLIEVLEVDQ